MYKKYKGTVRVMRMYDVGMLQVRDRNLQEEYTYTIASGNQADAEHEILQQFYRQNPIVEKKDFHIYVRSMVELCD